MFKFDATVLAVTLALFRALRPFAVDGWSSESTSSPIAEAVLTPALWAYWAAID